LLSQNSYLWMLAVVAGLSAAIAMSTMVRSRKAKLASVAVPAAAGIPIIVRSAVLGYDTDTALHLYTLATFDLALLRVVFGVWLRRQWLRHDQGLPPQEPRLMHFLVVFPVVVGGIVLLAYLLSKLETALT
jgi:hypothetical protein